MIRFSEISKEEFKKLVENNNTIGEILKSLNKSTNSGNYQTFHKYAKLNEINIDKLLYYKKEIYINGFNRYKELKDILIENSTYLNTHSLKRRLYNEGIKKRECELCGQGEIWNGKKISLILDHINGKHNDNRIENLQIVCPNCNATLDTHCSKNKAYKKIKNICECGNTIYDDSKECKNCHYKNKRIYERPDYGTLLNDVELLGYSGTGRKYGVSDNSIRKWIKFYTKYK